ncbi:hypothetical protein [Streptomyces sp. NRRL S-448]|uniref:hypothetical protein n=1 Tax=Streptomyces sp. NRRL S-448 TaxID=1463907 RepID=UPI000ADEF4E6
MQRTLLLQAVLFAGCLVLVFALPKVRGRELGEFEEKRQDTAIIGMNAAPGANTRRRG